MTQFEQLIIYGLASIQAEQSGYAVAEVLQQWMDGAKALWPATSKTRNGGDADVEEIYGCYPSRDPNNGNRPTGKGQKDRNTIKRLLAEGKYTKDELIQIITQEVKTRNETGSYLRNFSTLLANLPDIEEGDLF